jgi:hypothetical protein
MSKTFREWTLDQALLLPPSVHDFVPAGHLSRFVVALVTEKVDHSAIMASYKGEKGQPPARRRRERHVALDRAGSSPRGRVMPSPRGRVIVAIKKTRPPGLAADCRLRPKP